MHLNVTIGDFRKKVLDKKNTIADEVFLVSEAARHYIENMAEAVTGKYNSAIKVGLTWGSRDDFVAYATPDNKLVINVNNDFVMGRDDRAMKLVIMKALTLHECGHLLFTDFRLLESSRKVFMDGKLFPAPKCEEYNEWQIDTALMTPAQLDAWSQIWHHVQNCVEDGFIEWKILSLIPGDGKCLLALRELQKEADISVKQMRANELPTRQILFNLLLMLSKYGSVKMDPDDKQDPAIEELLKDYDLIAKATKEQKSYERVKLINEIFVKLYKFLKEEKKKEEEQKQQQQQQEQEQNQDQQSQQGQSNDQQGEGSGNDAQNQQNGESSDNGNTDNQPGNQGGGQENHDKSQNPSTDCGAEQSGTGSSSGNSAQTEAPQSQNGQGQSSGPSTGPMPDPFDLNLPKESIKDNIDNGSSSVLNDKNIDKDAQQEAPAKDNAERLSRMENNNAPIDAQIPTPEDLRKADSIAEQIAQDEVKAEAEKELAENLKDEAATTNYSGYNKGVRPELSRKEPSDKAYAQYAEDEEAIKNDVKKLVREIKDKIKDRQNGGKINGLYQGRYLDNHSLYRFDQRVLCKNDLPEDIPNMAFSLMIDGSGSMSGRESVYARRTALMLYEFGRELNVPVMVYSHNCHGSTGVRMQALADYGSVDGKDKYRICDYSPSGCNRDGVALRFCSKKLSGRPEETKICFIISDGLPSAYDDRNEAYGDIRDTLMEYSKKGVKYIACGLGDDAPRIKDIYQQGLSPKVRAEFLDCTDPSKLPVGVVRAIKELIK